jgi:iron complex transport system substrate-binding protein
MAPESPEKNLRIARENRRIARKNQRIASLLPAATEILCALGLEKDLVGVSHECDFPPTVRGLPVLTRARGVGGDSRAIDREIRRVLREGLSVFEVDVEALERARPDIVVTQDLCEVCAVSLDDVRAAARTIGAEIVSLHPLRLRDVLEDVRRVGSALGVAGRAEEVVAGLEARIEDVRRRASGPPRRSVLTVEWLDPVMIGGTWMPDLVEIAGGVPLAARAGEPAPTLDRDALAALSPDVVLVKPCGFDLARTRLESGPFVGLTAELGWKADVWLADGNAYFNRPGPRIVDSLEILAACVHPATFADLAERYDSSPGIRSRCVRDAWR